MVLDKFQTQRISQVLEKSDTVCLLNVEKQFQACLDEAQIILKLGPNAVCETTFILIPKRPGLTLWLPQCDPNWVGVLEILIWD